MEGSTKTLTQAADDPVRTLLVTVISLGLLVAMAIVSAFVTQ